MHSTDAKARLIRLQAERMAALDAGVQQQSPYLRRLADAIDDARVEYTTSAVTEIAALRSELTGFVVG
jgi:hypothetical protein